LSAIDREYDNSEKLALFSFIFTTLISFVVFLNLLIAVIGDVFEKVQE
jgi:hypothetical protein